MISAIFTIVSLPPGGQKASSGAVPLTIASANPWQPAKPHAPQFAPGSASTMRSTLGSWCTTNTRDAYARMAPRPAASPVSETTDFIRIDGTPPPDATRS
jgi:hypothetical protein